MFDVWWCTGFVSGGIFGMIMGGFVGAIVIIAMWGKEMTWGFNDPEGNEVRYLRQQNELLRARRGSNPGRGKNY